MSDPSCHDLIKASGNFIARCFQEPIGCVADDRIDCENGCMLKLAYKAGKDEAAALIERLQKELKEARERENNYRLTLERLNREESTIRSATIEQCATVADDFASNAGNFYIFENAEDIAKAIRSIDGEGK